MKKRYNGYIRQIIYWQIVVDRIPGTRKWGIRNIDTSQWMYYGGLNAWHTMKEANAAAEKLVGNCKLREE